MENAQNQAEEPMEFGQSGGEPMELSQSDGEEYTSSSEHTSSSDEGPPVRVSDDVMNAVKALADALQITKIFERKPLDKITKKSQLEKANKVRRLVNTVYMAISPSCPGKLRDLVESNSAPLSTKSDVLLDGVLEKIADEYRNAQTPALRNAVLSLVSPSVPYSTLMGYFPKISPSTYLRSKYIRSIDEQLEKESSNRQRCPVEANHFSSETTRTYRRKRGRSHE